jgi:hypothetical protein
MSAFTRPLSKRNADALAQVKAGPVLASSLHAVAVWTLWSRGLVALRWDSPDGAPVPAAVFGDFPPAGVWVTAPRTVEADLEARVRQHAASCDVSRFAAAYEFASMLDGYDPAKWRALATSRGLHPVTGKPVR